MLHELVETAHVIARQMRRLRLFVAPAFGYPDKARNTGVFGKAVLQAAIERLHMPYMQDDALSILRKILRLNLHKTLNYNHVRGLTDSPLPLGKFAFSQHRGSADDVE